MLHLSNSKWLSSPRSRIALRSPSFAFKWNYLECKRKKCSPLKHLALFCTLIIIKKSHLRGKIWFSDNRFNDSENQIHRGVYLLASLLGFLSFHTAMKTTLYLFSMCFTFVYFTQGLSFFLNFLYCVWSKDVTVQAEVITPHRMKTSSSWC